MEIVIYKDFRGGDYRGTQVGGGTEGAIAFLRKKLKRNKCDRFTYCWDEDGNCAMSDDEEGRVEEDLEKMLSLVSERIDRFGYCRFGCRMGEFVIRDYDNIGFLQEVISDNMSRLEWLKSKNR